MTRLLCTNSVTWWSKGLASLALYAFVSVAQPPIGWAQDSSGDTPTLQSTEARSEDGTLDVGALLGVPPDPANLLGLTPADVRALFGDPMRIDDVPPALSWHFVEADCVMDLIFYEAVTTRNLRVLTYDVTSSNEADDADASCLRQLLARDG